MYNKQSITGDRCILHPRAVTDGTLALSASCLILTRGGLTYVVL